MSSIMVTIEREVDRATLGGWWRDLEARSDARVFLSWAWIGTWLELIDIEPRVLIGRQDGAIVALALLLPREIRRYGWLVARGLYLHATGDQELDTITIEHNGILVDRTVARAATQAVLSQLAADDGSWDELHCPGVNPDLAEGVRGFSVQQRANAGSSMVDLDQVRASGHAYLDHLSANTRQQVRRAMRQYETRGPLQLSIARTVADALSHLDALGELHQAYWTGRGQPGAFSVPFFTRFHRALIERHHDTGLVELARIAAGPATLGYLLNLNWRGCVSAYQSGFAYEGDPKLKPGLVSHVMCIEWHLAAGHSTYDFLGGDAQYKASLGEPGPRHAYLLLQRPRLKFAVERGLRRVKRLVMRPAL